MNNSPAFGQPGHRPRSPNGGRLSVGAEKRAAVKYRETKVRHRDAFVPTMETVAIKVGPLTYPARIPKMRLNAHGVLDTVGTKIAYKTCTLVRA